MVCTKASSGWQLKLGAPSGVHRVWASFADFDRRGDRPRSSGRRGGRCVGPGEARVSFRGTRSLRVHVKG